MMMPDAQTKDKAELRTFVRDPRVIIERSHKQLMVSQEFLEASKSRVDHPNRLRNKAENVE